MRIAERLITLSSDPAARSPGEVMHFPASPSNLISNLLATAVLFYGAAIWLESGAAPAQARKSSTVRAGERKYLDRAREALELGKWEEAISNCKKIDGLNLSSPESYLIWSAAAIELDQVDQSLALINKTIKQFPGNADAYYLRASANQKKYNYKSAFADLKTCLSLSKCHEKAFLLRAMIYGDLRRYEKKANQCTLALKCNPRFAEAYFQRGRAYERMFEPDKAQKDYKLALALLNEQIKHSPRKVELYRLRSKTYGEMHNQHMSDADRRMADKLQFGSNR